MNDSRCMVCKYQGDHSSKDLLHDRIYRDRGPELVIALCYHHSWEFFRYGQKKFLGVYKENFMQVFGTETDQELIDHLKGSGKNSQGNWIA